jgi:hypothetical protein
MYEGSEGRIINSGIVSYYSFQNLSSFRMLSNNVNFKNEETWFSLFCTSVKVGLSLKKYSVVAYTSPVSRRCTEEDKHIDFKFCIYLNLWAGIVQSKLGHGSDNQGIVSRFSVVAVSCYFSLLQSVQSDSGIHPIQWVPRAVITAQCKRGHSSLVASAYALMLQSGANLLKLLDYFLYWYL